MSVHNQLEKSFRQTECDREGKGQALGGRQSLRASRGKKEDDMMLEGRLFAAEGGTLLSLGWELGQGGSLINSQDLS